MNTPTSIKQCSLCQYSVNPDLLIYAHDDFRLVHSHECAIAGYVIIYPTSHITRFCDIPLATVQAMMSIVHVVQRALYAIPHVNNVYLISFAELTPHYHMHIFPRYDHMLLPDQPSHGAEIFTRARQQAPFQGITADIKAAVDHLRASISA